MRCQIVRSIDEIDLTDLKNLLHRKVHTIPNQARKIVQQSILTLVLELPVFNSLC